MTAAPQPDRTDPLPAVRALASRVARAARASGRDPGAVRMLLATKTVDPERIREVLAAGYRLIGENRVQELVAKAGQLSDLAPLTHFIGHLQTNKVGTAVPLISCLQSLDSERLARAVQDRLERDGRSLEVLIQVNVSGEDSKYGLPPTAVPGFLRAIAPLDRLRVDGFMTIGLNSPDQGAVRAGYRTLRELGEQSGLPGPVALSMGMSGDFELAIAEGATIVRLGSAAFGARPQPPTAGARPE